MKQYQDQHPQDNEYIYDQLHAAPKHFRKHIMARYHEIFREENRQAANLFLLDINQVLKSHRIGLHQDDDYIRMQADIHAKGAALAIAKLGYFAGEYYTRELGIEPPEIDGEKLTERGATLRLGDPHWWRRQLRKTHNRAIEGQALDLNIVSKQKGLYVSDQGLEQRRSQKKRNRAILESLIAINEHGDEYTLQELSDLTVSNPEIRRGELMTRINGIEEAAKEQGYVGEFWTITCPSRMHSAHSGGGQRNEKYDGTTPREAQQYLAAVWAKIRAKFKRKNLDVYGIRVAEPQHDGTPHWHLLVFMHQARVATAREIVRYYALLDNPNEKGAQKYRFDAKAIDWSKGSAAGYIAKYIAKNIDGFKLDTVTDKQGNELSKNPNEAAERVEAWAACWGIRQFQVFGSPPVTIWRLIRKYKNPLDGIAEQVRLAADEGNHFLYIKNMGGMNQGRDCYTVKLFKEPTGKLGKYEEEIQEQIIGILDASGEFFAAPLHKWEIKKVSNNSEAAFDLPWSSVNNCTEVQKKCEFQSEKTEPKPPPKKNCPQAGSN